MGSEETTAKREVADDIEDLVADEFIGEAERFLAENAVPAGDDGVFQTPSLDEPLVHERLHILVENKGPRGGDFFFVKFGRDLGGEELGEAALGTDLGAGDAELRVG